MPVARAVSEGGPRRSSPGPSLGHAPAFSDSGHASPSPFVVQLRTGLLAELGGENVKVLVETVTNRVI